MVMEQYKKHYNDFMFLGVFFVNFSESNNAGHCYGEKMCTFILSDLRKICYTDRADQSGQH
jgi:hypothetical protein